mmetsp:Transcript_90097/g.205921  ORF Transcript_90097/g.205921 Transcript_90097/m.205921 type:complete len:101 (+) Transcript_90097:93-395(+)
MELNIWGGEQRHSVSFELWWQGLGGKEGEEKEGVNLVIFVLSFSFLFYIPVSSICAADSSNGGEKRKGVTANPPFLSFRLLVLLRWQDGTWLKLANLVTL